MKTFIYPIAVAAAVLVALAVPSPAMAAPLSRFTNQALSAGLSRIQADALQQKVDAYRTAFGGQQVAANKVEFPGGVYTATVPGELTVRDLSAKAAAALTTDHCLGSGQYAYNGWFCAYHLATYHGDELQWYNCGRYSMPWAGTGSWVNNQTQGTPAYLINSNLSVLTQSFAYDSSSSYNWTPVWYVDVCYEGHL